MGGPAVSKETGPESIDSISSSAQQNQQIQVSIDDTTAPTLYSSSARVWTSPEDIAVDFFGRLRPTSPKSAVLKVEQRIVLNPYAAKRLALSLAQSVQQYEHSFGHIELDEQKRRVPQGAGPSPISAPRA
jgi:hypothetical protein